MTKPNSPDVKVNSFKIRASDRDLEILHANAKELDMPMAQYVRWRGMQPIEEIKKQQEQNKTRQTMKQSAIATYLKILKELNHQGINLTHITRAVNSGELNSKSVEHLLESITQIKSVNQEILKSITDVQAKL